MNRQSSSFKYILGVAAGLGLLSVASPVKARIINPPTTNFENFSNVPDGAVYILNNCIEQITLPNGQVVADFISPTGRCDAENTDDILNVGRAGTIEPGIGTSPQGDVIDLTPQRGPVRGFAFEGTGLTVGDVVGPTQEDVEDFWEDQGLLEATGKTAAQSGVFPNNPLTQIDFAPPAQPVFGDESSGFIGNYEGTNAPASSDFFGFNGWKVEIKDLALTDLAPSITLPPGVGPNCIDDPSLCNVQGAPFPNPPEPPRVKNFLVFTEPFDEFSGDGIIDGQEVDRLEFDLISTSLPGYTSSPGGGGTVVSVDLFLQGYKVIDGVRVEEQRRIPLPNIPGLTDRERVTVWGSEAVITLTAPFTTSPDDVRALYDEAGEQPDRVFINSFELRSIAKASTFISGNPEVQDVPEPTTIISFMLLGGGVFGFTKRNRN